MSERVSVPGRSVRATPRAARAAALARLQAEADFVQSLLLEEASVARRRSGGFDVPDFLPSGPRDILVPSSGADAAREILGDRRDSRRAARQQHPRGCGRWR